MRKILSIGIIVIISACGEKQRQEESRSISIAEPLVDDFSNDDSEVEFAMQRITNLLLSKNAPVDSLYLKNYQTDSIPWTFHIQHYTTYVYDNQWKLEEARIDSLLKIDSTEWVEYKMTPATGNISGYDRWIEYFPGTGKVNDYLLQ